MDQDAEILFEVKGGLGRVLLNRPKALNALTHGMCVELDDRLKAWAEDPKVRAVLVRGAGGRAFCAGGDIRRLYDEGKGSEYAARFYWDEYRCNARLKHFPKPYIAFLDGIVMGGGVGISVHGSHRVLTETTMFAMPETGIGLFPDVGGSYFLPRCPGQLGVYLGLTGQRLKAADTLYAGVGTHYVPAGQLDALEEALAAATAGDGGGSQVSGVLQRFAADPGAPDLARHRALIDRTFGRATIEAVLDALDAEDDAFARQAAQTIRSKSPTSLKITLRQLRDGALLDIDDCMRMEWRMVMRVIRGHDFFEGTRAVVVDKDQKPVWLPGSLDAVTAEEVNEYFKPWPPGDLTFEWDRQATASS